MRTIYKPISKVIARLCATAVIALCLMPADAEEDVTEEERAKYGVKPAGLSVIQWEQLKAKRPMPFDNGPATINVSGYPCDMRKIYRDVFSPKCSQCHTLARPINSTHALPEEWKKYVKRMMKKPGSNIDPKSAVKIHEFLVYDSSIRKKDLLAKKKNNMAAPVLKEE
jgi:hypothetical protein